MSFKKGDIVRALPRRGIRMGKYTVVRKMRGFLPRVGMYEVQHEKADYTVSVGGDEVELVSRPKKKPKEPMGQHAKDTERRNQANEKLWPARSRR